MSGKWISSFKDISWSKVQEAVPAIVEGARKAWGQGGNKPAKAVGASPDTTSHGAPTPESLQVWIDTLDKRTRGLAEEAVASFDVVRSITEQHSKVVEAVDLLLERTRVLLWTCAALTVAVLALFVLLAIR